MSHDDRGSGRGRKNPWGNTSGNKGKGRDNPWGDNKRGGSRRGGNGGGHDPKDIDDLIKNAQEGLKEVLPGNMNGGVAFILIALAIILLWLASGFHIINPGEHGVIQRFGAWSRTQTQEGLGYHFPAPIEKIQKVSVDLQRSMTIGYRDMSASRSYGYSTVSTNQSNVQDVPEESLMLTADRNIVKLHVTIQWNLKSAEDYLFEIENPDNTIKKVSESAIREVIGQTEMFPIISTGRNVITQRIKEIIQKNLDEYKSGVNIQQVLFREAQVHPDVQRAFQDVQSARQDAEDTQNVAEAYRQEILPKARGEAIQIIQQAEAYKQSKIAQATGDAESFKAIYQSYLAGKDVTKERIYIETMERVLGNAEKIIIDDNGKAGGVVPYLPLNELNKKKQ